MEFEQWVATQGFEANSLSVQQTASLQSLFDRRQGDFSPSTAAPGDGTVEGSQPSQGELPPPNPTPQPPLDPVDALRARWSSERRRIAAITDLCAGNHPALEARAIEEGWTAQRTELEILRASRPKPPPMTGEEPQGLKATSLEAALCLSAGLPEARVGQWYGEQVMNQADSRELRGAGLHMLLYEVIRASGNHVRPGRIDNDVIRAAFVSDSQLIQASGGFSTISLAGILSNVANKTMLAAYEAVNAVATEICGATDVNDFKQVTRYRMTAAGIFQKVGPDGELKHAGLDESNRAQLA